MRFIQRFQQDYEAEVHYLVENYRSTRYIIEAANRLIAANFDRIKTRHPIRIDCQSYSLSPAQARELAAVLLQLAGEAEQAAH